MEQIKEAIKKAKADRKSVGVDVGSEHVPTGAECAIMEQQAVAVLEPNLAILEANRLVSFCDSEHGITSFDILRTRILQTMKEKNWQSIAVTSPGVGAGKTFVALNLAGSIARLDSETPLLVDFDFRKPSISRYLGLEMKRSLIDHLVDDTPLSQIIVKIRSPEMEILPNLKPVPGPGEMIASSKVENLVKGLHNSPRWSSLIFDLPPVLLADDVIAFLPIVDCVLLVIAAGSTTIDEIENCFQLLEPFNILGTVLNKSVDEDQGYYSY